MIQTIWMSLGKRLFVLLHLRGNKHFLKSCWYIQIPGHFKQTICRSGMIVEEMLKQPNIRVSGLPHNCKSLYLSVCHIIVFVPLTSHSSQWRLALKKKIHLSLLEQKSMTVVHTRLQGKWTCGNTWDLKISLALCPLVFVTECMCNASSKSSFLPLQSSSAWWPTGEYQGQAWKDSSLSGGRRSAIV